MKKIYLLAFCTLSVGIVELVISGILPTIAEDLEISISKASYLISVFALFFAISGPILLIVTQKLSRKKLLMSTLSIFSLACLITFLSNSFAIILMTRIILAMCAALIISLCLNISTQLVKPHLKGKAISYIFVGLSTSLVIGIPLGILITNTLGWKYIFLFNSIINIFIIIFISKYIEDIKPSNFVTLSYQLKDLKRLKIISIHLTTILLLAGHYITYSYLTPILKSELQISSELLSIIYLIFGISAIIGGRLGGILSHYLGVKTTLIIIPILFAIILMVLPLSFISYILLLPTVIIWGALSWAFAPAAQSFLIEAAPETSDMQQSCNTSAIQLGIGLGTILGSIVLNNFHNYYVMPFFGALLSLFSFLFAFFAIKIDRKHNIT